MPIYMLHYPIMEDLKRYKNKALSIPGIGISPAYGTQQNRYFYLKTKAEPGLEI